MVTTQQLELLAPLSGVLMPLEQVPDPVFSSRLMGDGLCIDPTSQVLCAPLAGVISNLQHTGHAVSITDASGVQVLLHIGLDTVNLGGQGFTCLVEEGQQVVAGQALIEFDADYVAQHARSLLTLMLVVSGESITDVSGSEVLVEAGQPVLRVGAADPQASTQQAPSQGDTLFSLAIALPNPNGLHARPAAVFAQAAKGFAATIELHKHEQRINAKSLVAIMTLQTSHGDVVQVSATGEDAEQAIRVLSDLLLAGCGEAVTPVAQVATETTYAPAPEAVRVDDALLRGVCASSGAVFGQVVQIAAQTLDYPEAGAGEAFERAQLQRALLEADTALDTLGREFSQGPQGQIFSAHRELLQDPTRTQPLFIHAVTMENHGPLHLEQVEAAQLPTWFDQPLLQGMDDLAPYLRHIANADLMLGKLRTTLLEQPNEALLCFFGDHVPILPDVYQAIGEPVGDTDYLIWSNRRPLNVTPSPLQVDRLACHLLACAAQTPSTRGAA